MFVWILDDAVGGDSEFTFDGGSIWCSLEDFTLTGVSGGAASANVLSTMDKLFLVFHLQVLYRSIWKQFRIRNIY